MGITVALLISILAFAPPVPATPDEFQECVTVVTNHLEKKGTQLAPDTSLTVKAEKCPSSFRKASGECCLVTLSEPLPPRSLGSEEYLKFIVDRKTKEILEAR